MISEALAVRLRLYVGVVSLRWFFIGLTLWISTNQVSDDPEFDVLTAALSLHSWGVTLFVFAILCEGGVLWPRPALIRGVLVISTMFGVGLALALVSTGSFLPAAILFLGCAAADGIMATMPYPHRSDW